MARPRTPTNILELRGAFKVKPSRKRTNEPKPIGDIGKFSIGPTDIAGVWAEIEAQIATGVLTIGDRTAFELLCRLVADMRSKPKDFTAGKVGLMALLLAKFGLTPSDRSRVSVAADTPAGEWADF